MLAFRQSNFPVRLRLFLFGVLLVTGIPPFSHSQIPHSDHVFVVVEENQRYEHVIGNSAMPYLNSLAKSYGLAANYDANSHYSIANYFWLTAEAFVTNSDKTTKVFDIDNVTRYLMSAGKNWKMYAESIPSVGYTGPTTSSYSKNHNPFSYFTDVVNSSEKVNMVPTSQLASDVSSGALPNYAFITPNNSDNTHNQNLGQADQWLKTNIGPLLASPAFQPGGNGILFITFDESVDSDCRPLSACPPLPENSGGGRVATLVIGPMVKPGYRSGTLYQHPSLLKTMLLALGISGAPAAAQSAPAMADFFTTAASNTLTIVPSSLIFGSQTVGTTTPAKTVQVTNNNNGAVTFSLIAASGDFVQSNNCGSSLVAGASCSINVTFTPTASGVRSGSLTLTDTASNSPQSVGLSGTGTTGGCTVSNVDPSVTICTPASGQTVTSPVHIVAKSTDSKPVKYMQIYVDFVKQFSTLTNSVDTTVAMTAGEHRLTVQAYDGVYVKQTIFITVQ